MGDRSRNRNRDGLHHQALSQKSNRASQQSLNTVVLVAGSCWLLTSSRWSAGLGLAIVVVVVVVGRRRK